MTTARTISEGEAAELWEAACRRDDETDPQYARDLYLRYGEEGHLVVFTAMRGWQPDEWYVHCAGCKDNPWGMTSEEILVFAEEGGYGGSAKPGPWLLNFGQAKWWAWDHREEQGLERQEMHPAFPIDFIMEKLDEGN